MALKPIWFYELQATKNRKLATLAFPPARTSRGKLIPHTVPTVTSNTCVVLGNAVNIEQEFKYITAATVAGIHTLAAFSVATQFRVTFTALLMVD